MNNREAEKKMNPKERMREYIKRSDVEGIKRLVEQHGIHEFRDVTFQGKNVYLWSISEYQLDLLSMLLNKGWDIDDRNRDREGGMYYAFILKSELFKEMTTFLIEKGIDINQQCMMGKTAFYKAIELDCTEEAEFLYEKGVDVNIKTNWGVTAIDKLNSLQMETWIPKLLQNPERLTKESLRLVKEKRLLNIFQ